MCDKKIPSLKGGLINNDQGEFDRALSVLSAYGYGYFAILVSNEELSIIKNWDSDWIEDRDSYKGFKIIIKDSNN